MRGSLFLSLVFLLGCIGGGGGGGSSVSTTSIDPLASYMWHLKDTGTSYVNGNTPVAGKNINLGAVHETATGQGVKIVVSDGRVDLDHPELDDNADLSLSKDYRLASPYFGTPGSSDNLDSHGTAVAGLALGKKGNLFGGFGVAPDATLVGYNYLESDQAASKTYDQATLSGSPGIFNYSYGYANCSVSAGAGFTYAMLLRSGVVGNDHTYVTAAGNDYTGALSECGGSPSTSFFGNSNLDQINTYPYVIVVGATTSQGLSADYSTPGSNVWVSAPGGDTDIGLMVADVVGCSTGSSPGATIQFDTSDSASNPQCSFFSEGTGTSYAAPIVTGAIAVLREVNPDLSWRDIKHILAETAVKIDPTASATTHPTGANLGGHTYQQGWVTNAASYSFHPWYGLGQINLSAAKALAENPDFDLFQLKTTDTMTDALSYSTGTVNLGIPDNSSVGRSSSINVSAHHLVIEHVQVSVNITHPFPGDLGLELTSPSGTTTKLMNINNNMLGTNLANVLFGANGFYGERSRGNWTLKVIDGAALDTGTLVSWSISIVGNRGADLADITSPSPASGFARAGANLTWTASPSGDVARYEICIATTSLQASGCIDSDWRPVRSGVSLTLNSYVYRGLLASLTSGVSYTAKIRAIDTSENESSVVTTSWTHP
jgi:subtilisin-like proprotein convertase family protein